ncbi:MAG TPA: FlgD immunoglobulin-like domain containing protein [Candidatus Omnitrophota bacterium]|nr:FlgD immunoglobulin-like domain containing protein [Candidatus Omnitrophota bacterium]
MRRRASSIFAERALRRSALAAAGLLFAATTLATPGRAAPAVPRSASIRAVSAPGAPSDVIDALEAAGYRVHVALLPSTYYVSAGAGARTLPLGVRALDVSPVRIDPAPEAPVGAAADVDPFGGRADALPVDRSAVLNPPLAGTVARAGIAPPGSVPPAGFPSGSRWEDTSEFMIGRVAVPILFAESDGTVDPNHFDWTPALRDSVLSSAVRGFLKWSVMASSRNIPLTFLIEPHFGLATRYEPIDRTIGQETLWIEDVLEPLLGTKGDALTMAYSYANAARARLNAQWAAIAFAVQNDTSATGTFPDGYIAHSELGGPWFVMPVNNLNTRSASLDYYFEHEITHQFWALDEYPALNAWWACTLTTGYFNRPNRNASVPADGYCGIPTVHCLMKGNYPDDWCEFTTDQIGWVDLDGSGILDLYETRPAVRPDSTNYRTGAGLAITLRGEADENAFPNRNPYHSGAGDSISIATVDSIEYRLDSGSWVPIPCGDGRCDSGEERFTLVLPPLSTGNHIVEWRAWNSSGRTALVPSGTTLNISGASPESPGGGGASPPAAPRVVAAPAPLRGEARLRLTGPPGSAGSASILDLAGRVVRTWPVAVPAGGVLTWRWDGRGEGGGDAAAGLYFVVVKIGSAVATHRVLLLR